MNNITKPEPPLCVDLDGTLVKLDTLHQAVFLLIRRYPFTILKLPGWIKRGRAFFKNEVMKKVILDVSALPYNQKFIDFLHQEKKNGRKLILTTAANFRTAQAVADHLNIFDEILASSPTENLYGLKKQQAILNKYQDYDYAGDSIGDLPVFNSARKKILVNPLKRIKINADHVIDDRSIFITTFFKALRPYQWIKNILIFTPILLAHDIKNFNSIEKGIMAFFSFSFIASAIYIFNDLLDLEADQNHPKKKYRPFASGNLQLINGLWLIPILLIISFTMGILVSNSFLIILLIYLILTTLYSIKIKQLFGLDVIILTILYILRVISGSFATGNEISAWFIGFSLFLFLSLALFKRFSELEELKGRSDHEVSQRERGYKISDKNILFYTGCFAALSTIIVLVGYILSPTAQDLYTLNYRLWFLLPLITYWFIRLWLNARRGNFHDDPLLFAITDIQTYIIAILSCLLIYFSI